MVSMASRGLAALRQQMAAGAYPCFSAAGVLQYAAMGRVAQHLEPAPHRHPVHTDVRPVPSSTPAWVLQSMPRFKGVLIDAAGTLLLPSENTADVYLRYARKYGVTLSPVEVLQRFRRAYNTPWRDSCLRYVGDGRPFWRHIVAESTGCTDEALFEEVYQYYVGPEAWVLAPGATAALTRLKSSGMRLAVVSNFDTRLRAILLHLGVAHLFDTIVVSAEVGVEKPNPLIYETALNRLGCAPEEVVHIGDDRRNDVWGARDAGVRAWLWGLDVRSFQQVADRVLLGKGFDWDDDYAPGDDG